MGVVKDPNQVKAVLQNRDKNVKGGVDVLLVGSPGCGKTTALAQIALNNLKTYDDVIVWRSSPDAQWSLFLNTKVKMVLWLRRGVKIRLFSRKKQKNVKLEDYFDKIIEWDTPDELVDNLERGCINVVQTIPYTPLDPTQHLKFCKEWVSIFFSLNKRIWCDTVSVLIDELEDLVPEGQSGDFWSMELALSGIIRALRKNGVSSFLAAHSLEEVHWRIKKKIRWMMFMKGANPGQNSRIFTTRNLKVGEALLEGNSYEKFRFAKIGEDIMLRAEITITDELASKKVY